MNAGSIPHSSCEKQDVTTEWMLGLLRSVKMRWEWAVCMKLSHGVKSALLLDGKLRAETSKTKKSHAWLVGIALFGRLLHTFCHPVWRILYHVTIRFWNGGVENLCGFLIQKLICISSIHPPCSPLSEIEPTRVGATHPVLPTHLTLDIWTCWTFVLKSHVHSRRCTLVL